MIEVRDGKLFRDQFLRNCVAGHHLETTGLLDLTQDSPFTTQIGIFSNPGFSHVLYCFVVDFSQTVCQRCVHSAETDMTLGVWLTALPQCLLYLQTQ